MSIILKGRRKITTQYSADETDNFEVVLNILNSAFPIHFQNKTEIDYLLGYHKGDQPILYKEKLIRPEISNNLVINHAQMVTRSVIGYFLGTPIQYIQSGTASKKEAIDKLNRYVAYEDKSSVDKEICEYQSITGVGYRIIYTDGIYTDDVPFEDKALNPAHTFVVYENNIAERPVLGVTYFDLFKPDGSKEGSVIYAYTKNGVWEIIGDGDVSLGLNDEVIREYTSYSIGGIPLIEYPNNMWRIGDWELMLALMDAINILQTGRLDDIDQIVQSLLVFINAEIDADGYDEMRERGVVLLKNTTNSKSEVKTIESSLDQSGMNMFALEMEELLYALLGIPSRNNRKGGGSDTGQAVELRDGWADLEIVARNKELTFKRSEKQALKIILNIMNANEETGLSVLDVDIKFSRNKNNNLLVKAQSYSTLLATKTLSPADCLTIVDLVSDVNEYISRGENFWEDQFAGKASGEESDFGETAILGEDKRITGAKQTLSGESEEE